MSIVRVNYASGAPMEAAVGYSRAVKIGNMIHVGGTTATDEEGTVHHVGDAYGQTKYVFEKMLEVVTRAGGSVEDVYHIRIFVTDISMGKDIATAYSEFFKPVMPLCTMMEVTKFFRPEQLVEIELDACIGARPEAV